MHTRLAVQFVYPVSTITVLAVFAALAGCGADRPDTHQVTGVVTYNSQPVEGAQVMFASDAGPPATAVTGANGHYKLATFSAGDGAVEGTYRVVITKNVAMAASADDPYPRTENQLPAKYSRAGESGLTAVVSAGGDNKFDFELKD